MNLKNRYARYIKSDHWRRLRIRAFQFHGRKCLECGSRSELQVHHKSYGTLSNPVRSWYSVTVDMLEVLCRYCHAARHPDKKQPPPRKERPKLPQGATKAQRRAFQLKPGYRKQLLKLGFVATESDLDRCVEMGFTKFVTEKRSLGLMPVRQPKKPRAIKFAEAYLRAAMISS